MYKKIWLGVLLVSAACGNPRLSSTEEELQQDKDNLQTVTDWRVFDAPFYFKRYNDLRAAFGYSEYWARWHWNNYGRAEGRNATPGFDVRYYINQYPDLKRAFGGDYVAGVWHFINHGIPEGRRGSIVFDPVYYLNRYEDLRVAFGDRGYEAAYHHWRVQGAPFEGRVGSAEFDPPYYLSQYADLRAAYGANNYWSAIQHFLMYGLDEGREGAPPPPVEPPVDPEFDAGIELDAGVEADGGTWPEDGGTVIPDAGTEEDGGISLPDAGTDAGVELDGGTGLPSAVVQALSPTPITETGTCQASSVPTWPYETLSCRYTSGINQGNIQTATPSAIKVTEWIVDAAQLIPELHAMKNTHPAEYERALVAMAQWIQGSPLGRAFPIFGTTGPTSVDRGLERGCDDCLCAINRLSPTTYCKYAEHLGEESYAPCVNGFFIFDLWANRCQAMHQQAWTSSSHRGFRAAAYAHNLAVTATCPPGSCTPSQIADLVVNLYSTNPTFPRP